MLPLASTVQIPFVVPLYAVKYNVELMVQKLAGLLPLPPGNRSSV